MCQIRKTGKLLVPEKYLLRQEKHQVFGLGVLYVGGVKPVLKMNFQLGLDMINCEMTKICSDLFLYS